ncbi:GNAT family N-acetyltransferase [Rhodanobacter sp. 7MK24]|uniref:GNAT family N-acetyltransferase n=1 Tax=Rhodanobacter sp. 7MK24 TaxID=2775922 RepID=UPI00177FD879|nr:GNAT family N-acetyltransferase [Rhodanobacter sp. 7MK24]MBD8880106.1 GNAT family N-acetyltransferase [Rhodanobacter sp. 7MK24]
MDIRLLDRNDAPAYQALRLQALRESPDAFSASHEDEATRSIDEVAARIVPAADGSMCMFGIFESGALAGFVALVHPQRKKLRHGAELAGMYVAPALRRRGLGAVLLHAVIAHARSIDGVRQLGLGVNATNEAAKALYRSAGFVRWGVQPRALQIGNVFHDEEHLLLRLDVTG